jgi:hypothetical protein
MYTAYATHIQRDDGAAIPIDEDNPDYRDYVAWLAGGNVPASPPEPTLPQLVERAIAEMRTMRQPIIVVLDGLQSSALTAAMAAEEPEEVEQAQERAKVIETAKQGLRDITKLSLFDCTTYGEMRAKVGAAYYALAAALPADIRQAFAEATK